jgi:hypothetical protein
MVLADLKGVDGTASAPPSTKVEALRTLIADVVPLAPGD